MNRKRIWELFWAWEFEKEEAWLRDMAHQGWALAQVGYLRYDFEPCEPGEYITRLELLENLPSDPKSMENIRFVEDTGAEYIGSVIRWVYFRKKAADGDFDLFSDHASRIAHLKRVISLIAVLAPINAGIGITNVCIGNTFGWINIAISVLLGFGVKKLQDRCRKMEEESRLFE